MPTPIAVGLEFLGAREARERDLGFGECERAGLRIAQHVLHDAAHQRHLARLVLSDVGMACDHVRHFVGKHRGELGRVVRQRDQPPRHVELPARQREGVDRRRIENGDAIVHVRPLGCGDELDHHLVEHGFEPGILVGAAIGGQDALMLALRRSGQLLLLGLPRRLRERWQRPRRRADREQGRTAARKREPENADTRNRAGPMKRPRHPRRRPAVGPRRRGCERVSLWLPRCDPRVPVSSGRRSRSAPGGWPRCAARCAPRPIRGPERGDFQAFSALCRRRRTSAHCASKWSP